MFFNHSLLDNLRHHHLLFLAYHLGYHRRVGGSRGSLSVEEHAPEVHLQRLKFSQLGKESLIRVDVFSAVLHELESVFEGNAKALHYIHDYTGC